MGGNIFCVSFDDVDSEVVVFDQNDVVLVLVFGFSELLASMRLKSGAQTKGRWDGLTFKIECSRLFFLAIQMTMAERPSVGNDRSDANRQCP